MTSTTKYDESITNTLSAIKSGLDALRAAQVEPMGLMICQDKWHWYKFKALPAHPEPGNAGHGYSHPVDLGAFAVCKGPGLALPKDATDRELLACSAHILTACSLNPADWLLTIARARDAATGSVRSIDLTRGGVQPFEEYPDSDLPLSLIGGDAERRRIRQVRANEQLSTDEYMVRMREESGI